MCVLYVHGIVRSMMQYLVCLLYLWFNNDKDGWTIMMQIELNCCTARQQRARVRASDSKQRRDSISRECNREIYGGYSMRGAAVMC